MKLLSVVSVLSLFCISSVAFAEGDFTYFQPYKYAARDGGHGGGGAFGAERGASMGGQFRGGEGSSIGGASRGFSMPSHSVPRGPSAGPGVRRGPVNVGTSPRSLGISHGVRRGSVTTTTRSLRTTRTMRTVSGGGGKKGPAFRGTKTRLKASSPTTGGTKAGGLKAGSSTGSRVKTMSPVVSTSRAVTGGTVGGTSGAGFMGPKGWVSRDTYLRSTPNQFRSFGAFPRPATTGSVSPTYWQGYWSQWDRWDYRHYYRRSSDFNWLFFIAGVVIPTAAIIAYSYGATNRYVCQAYYDGGIYPGSAYNDGCYFPYDNREIVVVKNYRILTGKRYHWVSASNGDVPKNAFIGGYTADNTPLYICRVDVGGAKYSGQVFLDGCYFTADGQVQSSSDYQVLVSR